MENKTILYSEEKKGKPILFTFHQYGPAADFLLAERQVLGRMSENSEVDIQIPSYIVSRKHGEFGVRGNHCFYRDMGSSNGTWINDEPCSGTILLKEGDILSFRPRREPDKKEFCMVLAICPENITYHWEKINLTEEIRELIVGRGKGAPLAVDDVYMSEKHASFFNSCQGWSLIDFKSTNGVYVNHQKISEPVKLLPMDLIRIGDTWFYYTKNVLWYGKPVKVSKCMNETVTMEYEALPKDSLVINIREKNVWSRFKKKTLLKDINLTVENGDFVLILGGSGAGKTTFMNAVMGYEKAEGNIHYGGLDVYEEYERIKYEIGFVPQQDMLRMNDTVYHTLYSASEMKMSSSSSAEEYKERTQWAMALLGLEREKDTLTGKLSGGQRKRLSIAVELVGNPGLLFLDEPDSGLDGIMAKSLIKNLRAIADMGKIVMIITHGPDRVAEFFTKVLVLAKSEKDNSGHLVYYGSIRDAKTYFGTETLEGIVEKINRRDEGGEGLADYYIERKANISC